MCRALPALLFCDLPYSTLIRNSPSFTVFSDAWKKIKGDERSKTYLDPCYFVEWPSNLAIPKYLLS